MVLSSLIERLKQEKKAFIEKCDLCGICIEKCQVLSYLKLLKKNSKELQEDLLHVLRGNEASQEACNKTFACSQCASCLHSCPKGLNPYLMQAVFKEAIVIRGQKPKKSIELTRLENIQYDLQDILCDLQLKPFEVRWLRKIPINPKQTDLLLFMGCSVRMMPDKILATIDILDKLELDYTVLAGGQVCCGFKYLIDGDVENAESSSRELVLALE